jgi:hypothetical protein
MEAKHIPTHLSRSLRVFVTTLVWLLPLVSTMGGKQTLFSYKRGMAGLLHRVAFAGLVVLAASASARERRAQETIRVWRVPMGLHSSDAPEFDLTLSQDGQVVVRRWSLNLDRPPYARPARAERVRRYRVSPAEAGRFRAALARHRAVEEAKLICGGQTYGPENMVMLRVPILIVVWTGAASRHVLKVCYTAQEQRTIEALERGLEVLHVKADGSPS